MLPTRLLNFADLDIGAMCEPAALYSALATQIARIVWAVCDHEVEGRPAFCHFHENNLDAPCDMLARLGLMRGGGTSHHFVIDWAPFEPPPLVRHAGEPGEDDLLLGLAFFTLWFSEDAAFRHRPKLATVAGEPGDLGKWTPARGRYRAWAIQSACALLVARDAGAWENDDVFRTYADIEDMEGYWQSRKAAIDHLGDEALLYPPRI